MSLLLLFPHPAAAGNHNLAAEDVESASEVTAPAITQVHSILAEDVESASETGSPAITQAHSILADNIESASEVSAPTLDGEPVVSGGGGGGSYDPHTKMPGLAGVRLRPQPFKSVEVEEKIEDVVDEVIEEAEELEKQAGTGPMPGQDIAHVAQRRLLAEQSVIRKTRQVERLSQKLAERQIEARINELVRRRRAFFISDNGDLQAILFILSEVL